MQLSVANTPPRTVWWGDGNGKYGRGRGGGVKNPSRQGSGCNPARKHNILRASVGNVSSCFRDDILHHLYCFRSLSFIEQSTVWLWIRPHISTETSRFDEDPSQPRASIWNFSPWFYPSPSSPKTVCRCVRSWATSNVTLICGLLHAIFHNSYLDDNPLCEGIKTAGEICA